MKKVITLLIFVSLLGAQTANRPEKLRWNTFNINKLWTKFNTDNLMAAGTDQMLVFPARPPAFEYPGGSGLNYAGFMGPVVAGLRQENCSHPSPSDGWPYVENAAIEGPAWYWDPQHWEADSTLLALDRAPLSTDPESWPSNWPTTYPDGTPIEYRPIKAVDPATGDTVEGQWPVFVYRGDTIIGDQEAWNLSHAVNYESERWGARTYWLDVSLEMHAFAWNHPWYNSVILWAFVVRNTGGRIDSAYIGLNGSYEFYADFQPFGGWATGGEEGDDRLWFDSNRMLIYGTDGNGHEIDPNGNDVGADNIAWAGVTVLKIQANGHDTTINKLDLYDGLRNFNTVMENGIWDSLFYYANLMNVDDPDDPDGDGFDQGPYDNNDDGIGDDDFKGFNPNLDPAQQYAYPYFTIGFGPFTMEPGEVDTFIVATVFGQNRADLMKNTDAVIVLANNQFSVPLPPPQPHVRAEVGDRYVKLIWGTESEADTNFEGYLIYRSTDGGNTWGDRVITDEHGSVVAYVPYAQYDLADGIRGAHPRAPWFWMGDDTGLDPITEVDSATGETLHVFVDDNVVNGMKYIYYVAAYSKDTSLPAPLANTPASDPNIPNDNTVLVIPSVGVAIGSFDSVRVVPNPYIVSAGWETSPGEERIDFAGLPERCTIYIYNASGDLVRRIEHDGGARESWDLLNKDGQQVAPGLYFYVITSDIGTVRGKLAIVH